MSMVKHGVQEAGTGNALFSPVSILTTLNMLLLGTQGDTRTELLTALGNTLHLSYKRSIDFKQSWRRPPIPFRLCPNVISTYCGLNACLVS